MRKLPILFLFSVLALSASVASADCEICVAAQTSSGSDRSFCDSVYFWESGFCNCTSKLTGGGCRESGGACWIGSSASCDSGGGGYQPVIASPIQVPLELPEELRAVFASVSAFDSYASFPLEGGTSSALRITNRDGVIYISIYKGRRGELPVLQDFAAGPAGTIEITGTGAAYCDLSSVQGTPPRSLHNLLQAHLACAFGVVQVQRPSISRHKPVFMQN